jgi:hypothetical protein
MPIVFNTTTGKSMAVPSHYLGHPVLGENLVLAEDYIPTVEEKDIEAPKKNKKEFFAPKDKAILPEPVTEIEENKE